MTATIHHFPTRTRPSQSEQMLALARLGQARWAACMCPALAADPDYRSYLDRKVRDVGGDAA